MLLVGIQLPEWNIVAKNVSLKNNHPSEKPSVSTDSGLKMTT